MKQPFDIYLQSFVSWRDTSGRPRSVGLKSLFSDAAALSPFGDGGPQTTFAVIRVLLVLLHQTRPTCDDGEWERLWDAGQFPGDWLAEIDAATAGQFDLFDAKRPFLQSASADDGKAKTASYLIPEFAAATNINFASHAYDDEVALCPSCCAKGLMLLAPFCGAGGSGLMASINNTQPVYFLPVGANLFQTLLLNYPLAEAQTGDWPQWKKREDSKAIGLLEGLTWEPRTVRLLPLLEFSNACSNCGETAGASIQKIVFSKGVIATKERLSKWRDPHVNYDEQKIGTKTTTRSLTTPEPDKRPGPALGFWRRVIGALLREPAVDLGCRAVLRARARLDTELAVSCVLPFTRPGQDKKHILRSDLWKVPLALEQRLPLLTELDWLQSGMDSWYKKTVADNNPMPAITPLAEFERRAEGHFRRLLDRKINMVDFRNAIIADVRGRTEVKRGRGRELDAARSDASTALAIGACFPPSEPPTPTQSNPHRDKEDFIPSIFLRRLQKLDVASRQALKTSALRPGFPDVAAHDAFTSAWWPIRNSYLPRDPCRLVASLYFWNPKAGGRGTLPAALRRAFGWRETNQTKATDKLVADLLAATPARRDELLLTAVRRLATARVAIDWIQLIRDLQFWDRRDVREVWANSWDSSTPVERN